MRSFAGNPARSDTMRVMPRKSDRKSQADPLTPNAEGVDRTKLGLDHEDIFDNMLEGIQIIGHDWRYLYVNNALAIQGKQKKEELLGHTMMERYPGIEKTEVFAEIRNCMEKKMPHSMDIEFEFPDGSKGWFETRMEPVPQGVLILSNDITERKKIFSQQAQLAAIVDSSEDAIIGKTLQGVITSWNKGAEHMYGYSAGEVIGKPVSLLVPKEHADEIPKILEKIGRGETVEHYRTLRQTKDGRIINVSLTASPIKNEHGEIVGASAIGRDITELVKAEEGLKNMNAELESRVALRTAELKDEKTKVEILLESIGDGVVAIDRSWNIILWNKAAGTITGYSKEDAIGKSFRNIMKLTRESDGKENITFIEEMMLFGTVKFMENHTVLVRKDGRKISLADSAAPVFDKKGEVAGGIIIFRDVTKEHELETSRQEFSSFATHELRTPVGIIKGYLELMFEGNQGSLTAEQKDSLTKMQQANERLHALVNAMLNITRIESGIFAIAPEPTYLPDLADGITNEMLPQMQEKKLRLEKQYAEDVPSVSVDSQLTGAVIRNLLSNAVKYTPEGGKITVKIGKKDQNVLITVSDTGLGIPKAQQAKMFTKFFRGDNVRMEHIEGTGLGLYIVKSILEQAGGTISFSSEENEGATFFITIPLAGMNKREGTKGLT